MVTCTPRRSATHPGARPSGRPRDRRFRCPAGPWSQQPRCPVKGGIENGISAALIVRPGLASLHEEPVCVFASRTPLSKATLHVRCTQSSAAAGVGNEGATDLQRDSVSIRHPGAAPHAQPKKTVAGTVQLRTCSVTLLELDTRNPLSTLTTRTLRTQLSCTRSSSMPE